MARVVELKFLRPLACSRRQVDDQREKCGSVKWFPGLVNGAERGERRGFQQNFSNIPVIVSNKERVSKILYKVSHFELAFMPSD